MQLPIPRHMVAAATLAFIVGTAVPGNAFAAEGSADLNDDNQVITEVVPAEDNETSTDDTLQAVDAATENVDEVAADGDVPTSEGIVEASGDDEGETEVSSPSETAAMASGDETAETPVELTSELGAETLATMSDDEVEHKPADGTYVFGSGLYNRMVLDVDNNGTTNGSNVQLYVTNGTSAQQWDVRHVSDGFYNILKYNTDMALSIANGVAYSTANVEIRKLDSNDKSQLWHFEVLENGYYYITSALNSKIGLDVKNGVANNRQNIWVYQINKTPAQKFKLFESKTADKSTCPLSDGTYTVKSAAKSAYSVDIANGSKSNGANAQLYSFNGTQAQKFYFKSDGKGYYTITAIGSAKVLTAENASPIGGNNVQQAAYTGADIQKWALYGSLNKLEIVNKATGLALDVSDGTFSNGSNLQGYYRNNTDAQKFALKGTTILTSGIYSISSVLDTSKVLDITNGSAASNALVQLYSSNNTLAQRFGLESVANSQGKELYMIRSGASGGYLTASGTGITQPGNHSTTANNSNTWELVWNGTYFSMRNVATGKVIDLPDFKTANGTKLQTWTANTYAAQHFYFDPTNLFPNGTYLINSAISNNSFVIDVTSASKNNGAQLQAYTKSGHVAQRFTFTATGTTNNTYSVRNIYSDKAMSVKDGSVASGANVVQNSYNSSDGSQLWRAEIGDGGYIVFTNVRSGLALSFRSGNSAQLHDDVCQNDKTYESAQEWKLTRIGWNIAGGSYDYYDVNEKKTTFNASSYDTWNRIKNKTSNTQYLIGIDRNRCWANIYIRQGGQWEPLYSWRCAVGSKGSPTPVGEWLTSGRRGTTHVDEEYTAKWVIEVKSPWAFNIHSTPFKPDGRVLTARLGAWITGGCCRLAVENAHWVYNNIRGGTRVITY